MHEIKKIDTALEKCQNLHGILNDFLRHVQKLNLRYNYNEKKWNKLRNELNDVICSSPSDQFDSPVKSPSPSKSPPNEPCFHDFESENSRSNKDFVGLSLEINMKIIKIKRSLESMMHEVQRSIKRHAQSDYSEVGVVPWR